MENHELSQISRKLDVLIKLSAANVVKDQTFREQVRLLSSVGLQPRDIAQLVGKSPNHVSVMLVQLKKQKRGDSNE